ncbi:hypothetical protein PRK78_004283 [Emydomyces testavorans]|uniref:Uncharacterized protein n=1 Tax=Emydomyces testavorans TaxID=2070801 RepID=A0AAF0DHU3_9EURO|nr:hypothetical protein PRK78_004283 [Emydomyces testavorans]
MPKPKTLLKDTKSKKKAKQSGNRGPETADEYLAEGVEFEEAGEKWRGGDAVKSMRFFMRAIDAYDTGLRQFPNSFDLAYNKYVGSNSEREIARLENQCLPVLTVTIRARVQYEITQHPKLASQLPAPMFEILQIALKSHREALNKDQDNADILFNTAQVLTSLAEAIGEGKRPSRHRIQEAIKYLQEALELFQRCLALQELRFTEYQEQVNATESGVSDQPAKNDQLLPPEAELPTSTPAEQWAIVVEPVTKNTLVDTAIAQLETLATLCGLLTYDPDHSFAWIEEYSSDLLREKLNVYAEGTDRKYDVALARAKFISTFTEVVYRNGQVDLETYKNELNNAFNDGLDVSNDAAGLCGQAEALVSFNSAVADTFNPKSPEELKTLLDLRWKSLSTALDSLTSASKLPSAGENLPKIHIARGDVEMYRWRLGNDPWNYGPANDNAALLLKNAETYYRGGAAIAKRDGWPREEREGTFKEALVKTLAGDPSQMETLVDAKEELTQVAEDMVEDGLIASEDLERILHSMAPDEMVF